MTAPNSPTLARRDRDYASVMNLSPADLAIAMRPLQRLLDGSNNSDLHSPAGDCHIDTAADTPFPSSSGNHLRGLGIAEAPTSAQVQAWVARYRAAGVQRCFAWIHPGPFATAAEARLSEHGFTPFRGTSYPTLARTFDGALPVASCPFVITAHAGLPDAPVAQGLDRLYGEPSWRMACRVPDVTWLVASDTGAVVAASMLVYYDGIAYLGRAQTAESHRRRGAQRALIARRLALAQDAGCRIATVETLRRCKESLRNLLHSGFVEIYAKQVLTLVVKPSRGN